MSWVYRSCLAAMHPKKVPLPPCLVALVAKPNGVQVTPGRHGEKEVNISDWTTVSQSLQGPRFRLEDESRAKSVSVTNLEHFGVLFGSVYYLDHWGDWENPW